MSLGVITIIWSSWWKHNKLVIPSQMNFLFSISKWWLNHFVGCYCTIVVICYILVVIATVNGVRDRFSTWISIIALSGIRRWWFSSSLYVISICWLLLRSVVCSLRLLTTAVIFGRTWWWCIISIGGTCWQTGVVMWMMNIMLLIRHYSRSFLFLSNQKWIVTFGTPQIFTAFKWWWWIFRMVFVALRLYFIGSTHVITKKIGKP